MSQPSSRSRIVRPLFTRGPPAEGSANTAPYLETQAQPAEAAHRLLHQHVLRPLAAGQVRHREAQVRAGVVPRHADDRLLLDEVLRRLLRVGEAAVAAPRRGLDVEEVRPAGHLRREADLVQRGDELVQAAAVLLARAVA